MKVAHGDLKLKVLVVEKELTVCEVCCWISLVEEREISDLSVTACEEETTFC